ncbi:MAG: biotin transporter BioY, partial [Planctomycetes bacterium]|nr:biotin transporter BioY [Planctomycetota bacterium]
GTALLLGAGTAGLRLRVASNWTGAFAMGFFPFIVGDTLKMLAAAAVRQAFFPPEPAPNGAPESTPKSALESADA